MAKKKSRRTPGGSSKTQFKPGNEFGKATRWVPGKSGNPIGLPKGFAHVRDLAKVYTGNAIRALVEVTSDELHPGRTQAAKALLDRGWGQDEVPVRLSGFNLGALTDEELEQIQKLARKATAADPGDDSGGEGSPPTG